MTKSIFVSVGSTHFDALISKIDSKDFIELAKSMGYGTIIAQVGCYEGEIKHLENYFSYASPEEFKNYLENSDLIIGHGGAGTILEVLQLGKPIVVVVNEDLMENHQTELAYECSKKGLLQVSTVSNFFEAFRKVVTLEPRKIEFDGTQFVAAIDDHFHFKITK